MLNICTWLILPSVKTYNFFKMYDDVLKEIRNLIYKGHNFPKIGIKYIALNFIVYSLRFY